MDQSASALRSKIRYQRAMSKKNDFAVLAIDCNFKALVAGRYLIVNGGDYRRSGGCGKACDQLFGEFFCSVDIPFCTPPPGQPKCDLVPRRLKRPLISTYRHNCMSSDPLSASQISIIMDINRLTTRWAGSAATKLAILQSAGPARSQSQLGRNTGTNPAALAF